MVLNKRCLSILETLIKNNDYIKITTLAEMKNTTERNVRYSLSKIDEFLEENKLAYLEKQYNLGVRLPDDKKTIKYIEGYISNETPFKFVYSKSDIKNFILLKLLIENDYVSISYFEDILYVSKTTILNIIEEIMNNSNYQISKRHKLGVRIKQDISKTTLDFAHLFQISVNLLEFYKFIRNGDSDVKLGHLYFNNVFDKLKLKFIAEKIRSIEQNLYCDFDDLSYLRLTVYLYKLINKDKNSEEFSLDDSSIDDNFCEKDISCKILKSIEKEYGIHFDKNQLDKLSSFLLTLKSIVDRDEKERIRNIIDEIISKVENGIGISFGEEKINLVKFLYNHISPMIHRMQQNIILSNPLYNDVVMSYPDLFNYVKASCELIEREFLIKINKHEISYLSMHFAAAIENVTKSKDLGISILVICVEGIATSKLIAANIKKLFHVEVVDFISLREFNYQIEKEFDIIVSTIDIDLVDTKKFLKINASLEEEDINQLREKFNLTPIQRNKSNLIKINKIINIIKENCSITDLYKLQYDLLNFFVNDTKNKEQSYFSNSKTIKFSKELIRIDNNMYKWEEAIKLGTSLLLDKGYINQSYQDKIIANIKEYGPYMVIDEGVILLHAGIDDGVNENCISIVSLKEGVDFKDRFNVKVKLVITLAVKEHKSFSKFIEILLVICKNRQINEELIKSNKVENIYKIIEKNLDQFIDSR
ncbi:PTS sugar transporter subunit IIA [Clostridium sp. AL.422]|uniref:BglG family transcription antiterminator n=1 Tax=Clostridium TaxID=1485 RepID=UPI00293DE4F9|nr:MULTISPECIES: PTS sugar transporter subunit IIA [unclassified Clostridium]MDV4151378.1 PTS sugar transporter subunit IIA [Clostridium sp. AL.422]